MNYNALIPVKSLNSAKSRLARMLSPDKREKLVLHMLLHTLQVLHETHLFTTIFVASADRTILDFAKNNMATPFFIPLKSQNSDLRNAVISNKTMHKDKLLTISSDIPLLAGDDIQSLVALAADNDIVLAPSKESTGTNALLCKPLLIPYRFGSKSLFKFQKEALEKNLSTALYNSPTIAFDLDTTADLRTIAADNKTYNSFLK